VLDFSGDQIQKVQLLKQLVDSGYKVTEFREDKTDLEDVFLRITNGALQ